MLCATAVHVSTSIVGTPVIVIIQSIAPGPLLFDSVQADYFIVKSSSRVYLSDIRCHKRTDLSYMGVYCLHNALVGRFSADGN